MPTPSRCLGRAAARWPGSRLATCPPAQRLPPGATVGLGFLLPRVEGGADGGGLSGALGAEAPQLLMACVRRVRVDGRASPPEAGSPQVAKKSKSSDGPTERFPGQLFLLRTLTQVGFYYLQLKEFNLYSLERSLLGRKCLRGRAEAGRQRRLGRSRAGQGAGQVAFQGPSRRTEGPPQISDLLPPLPKNGKQKAGRRAPHKSSAASEEETRVDLSGHSGSE